MGAMKRIAEARIFGLNLTAQETARARHLAAGSGRSPESGREAPGPGDRLGYQLSAAGRSPGGSETAVGPAREQGAEASAAGGSPAGKAKGGLNDDLATEGRAARPAALPQATGSPDAVPGEDGDGPPGGEGAGSDQRDRRSRRGRLDGRPEEESGGDQLTLF